jgi:hypothetical protein
MVRCDGGQIVTSRPLYSRANCQVSSDDVAKCRGTSAAVASISADTLVVNPKDKKKPTDQSSKTAKVEVRRLQAVVPATTADKPYMSITAPVDVVEENCYDFAAKIFNFSVYRINTCTIGDPDFIRGIYMNMLHAKRLFKDAKLSPTQLADNVATVGSDSNAVRSDAATKAASKKATVKKITPTSSAPVSAAATTAAPAATATAPAATAAAATATAPAATAAAPAATAPAATAAAPAATAPAATAAAPAATAPAATAAAPAATATAPAAKARRLSGRYAQLGKMRRLITSLHMARAISSKNNKKELRKNLRILQANIKPSGDDAEPLGDDNLSKFTVQFASSGYNISPNFGHNKLAQVSNLQLNKMDPDSMPDEAFGNLLKLKLGILVALSMIFVIN